MLSGLSSYIKDVSRFCFIKYPNVKYRCVRLFNCNYKNIKIKMDLEFDGGWDVYL